MRFAPFFDVKVAKFLLVGLANTGVCLSVLYATKWWIGLDDVSANLAGYGTGLAVSFALNKRWTFGFVGGTMAALRRFMLVFVVSYAANLATVLLLIRDLGIDGYWAQPVGIVPYTLLSYFGSRSYVFRQART